MFLPTSVPLLLLVQWTVQLIPRAAGYPDGPPATPDTCRDMFPGHGVNSQLSGEPPFELSMSMTVYTPWEDVRVRLQATGGHFIRGMLVQARRANCSHPRQHEALGTFQLLPGERYLKTISCNGRINSSVSHKSNQPLDHAVFHWHAPAQEVGNLYFVATVVKEKEVFWTNVYSRVIRYIQSTRSSEICPAVRLLATSTTPSAVTSPSSATGLGRVETGTAVLMSMICGLIYNQ